jgi:cysteine desulfurase/selenocysteine lyase
MPDWRAVREEFPALRKWTYLNSATYGQLPTRTTEAVADHFRRRDEMACADFLSWFDDADAIRASIATLINASPHDIAFFTHAAGPVSLVAKSIDFEPGDRILTLEHEFPNHLYLAQTFPGVIADIVPYSRFFDALSPRTRLVLLSTVNYTSGLRPDLQKIAAACRANGTLLSIDGTQSIGALRFDFAAVQPDIFLADGYKWFLSPNGAAFACIHPALRKRLQPNTIGWRSDKRWREVNNLNHGAPEFKSDAERYEGGILPFPAIYGMGASVGLFLELGPAAIEHRVLELAAHLRSELRNLGAHLLADDDPAYISPIVAARWPGLDPGELTLKLKDRRILTAARHGNLRVSTHFYNNEEDISHLCSVLKELSA